jgi:NAD(P)-dependent dehydrogenase (short-subunit alcohol dehydrogenase family)
MGSCSERIARVTGASRGIGRAVARRLAAERAANIRIRQTHVRRRYRPF